MGELFENDCPCKVKMHALKMSCSSPPTLWYRTQFLKTDLSVRLSFVDLHFCQYLFICLRSKCSVKTSFLLQLILVILLKSYKSRKKTKPCRHLFLQLLRIYVFLHGERFPFFLIIFSAYQPGCSLPVMSAKFRAEELQFYTEKELSLLKRHAKCRMKVAEVFYCMICRTPGRFFWSLG